MTERDPIERIRSGCANLASALATVPDAERAADVLEAFVDGVESFLRSPGVAACAARSLGGVLEDIRAMVDGRPTSWDILHDTVNTVGPFLAAYGDRPQVVPPPPADTDSPASRPPRRRGRRPAADREADASG